MLRLPYSKRINSVQLAAEIAAAHGWSSPPGVSTAGSDVSGEFTVHADADATKVQVVLDAHVSDPLFGASEEDKHLAALRGKAERVRIGSATFTTPELHKVLAALVLRATRPDS